MTCTTTIVCLFYKLKIFLTTGYASLRERTETELVCAWRPQEQGEQPEGSTDLFASGTSLQCSL